ncbi:serine hydrolase [Rhodobacteraceae bacterium PA1-206B]
MTLPALFATVFAADPARSAPFAAIIMDARTGETLWSQNADTKLHPASLTKMMTLYIAFQEIEAGRMSLDTVVTVSKHAAAQPPSRLGLRQGQKIKMRYLIRAAAIKSANDAAAAIGDAIAGSEAAFAQRMTRTARALGMKNTTFRNAHGLTAQGHLSTARDMNILGRHLFYDFPQYYNIFSRRSADAGIATVNNTNSRFLDSYEGADGIKTGYTIAAGFNLTASAKRGDKRLITTVFGGTSTAQRNAKMAELMNMGFGLAKNRVRERPPTAAPIPDASVPLVMAPADDPGVPGGAAKTIRVSGAMTRSLRPMPRPVAAPPAGLSDDVAMAIAASVQDAMAEPPPPATLEAQAVELAAAPAADPAVVETILAEVVTSEPAPGTLEAQAASLAASSPAEPGPAPRPEPGTFEAQALALAEERAPAETAPVEATPTDPAAVALSEATPETDTANAMASSLRPQPRPGADEAASPETALAQAEPAAEPAVEETVLLASAAPLEAVVPFQVIDESDAALALATAPAVDGLLAEGALTGIETVSAPANAPIYDSVETGSTERRAPIFDSVALATVQPEFDEEVVIVSKSTSGGRAWGVFVGAYNSRYEAERALLRTGLAESATLDQGLRKITERGGKYRATFLGLTEDQADLACRRIRARGVSCETSGPA